MIDLTPDHSVADAAFNSIDDIQAHILDSIMRMGQLASREALKHLSLRRLLLLSTTPEVGVLPTPHANGAFLSRLESFAGTPPHRKTLISSPIMPRDGKHFPAMESTSPVAVTATEYLASVQPGRANGSG